MFAPVAALVALAAAGVGGRGRLIGELLLGIAIGVVVGEVLVRFLGAGALQLALAAASAMVVAAVLRYRPIPLIQAGASAVLIVALHSPDTGLQRVLDAVVGIAVALVISQILIWPNPVSVHRRIVVTALRQMAGGLHALGRALVDDDTAAARDAARRLRATSLAVASDIAGTRLTPAQITRLTWRSRRQGRAFTRLTGITSDLDIVVADAAMVARAVQGFLDDGDHNGDSLTSDIDEGADALEALATALTQMPDTVNKTRAHRTARAWRVRQPSAVQ